MIDLRLMSIFCWHVHVRFAPPCVIVIVAISGFGALKNVFGHQEVRKTIHGTMTDPNFHL